MADLLSFIHHTPSYGVVLLLIVAILILGKAADVMVEDAPAADTPDAAPEAGEEEA